MIFTPQKISVNKLKKLYKMLKKTFLITHTFNQQVWTGYSIHCVIASLRTHAHARIAFCVLISRIRELWWRFLSVFSFFVFYCFTLPTLHSFLLIFFLLYINIKNNYCFLCHAITPLFVVVLLRHSNMCV